jgi:hypothetical protein
MSYFSLGFSASTSHPTPAWADSTIKPVVINVPNVRNLLPHIFYLQSHVITFSWLQCKHLSSHSCLGRFNNQTCECECDEREYRDQINRYIKNKD